LRIPQSVTEIRGMRSPPCSSGYRNPSPYSWNGTKSRNSLHTGRDGGNKDGKALDLPLAKRQRKPQPTSEGTSSPQTRLRCRPAAHDSSSTPTRRTRGGVNLGAFLPHTGWVKLGAFLSHTEWVNCDAFLIHTGWVNRGSSPAPPFKVFHARS
jgi:hypothetical protein